MRTLVVRLRAIGSGTVTISMDGHGPALQVTPEFGPELICLRLAGEMDVATAGHLVEVARFLPVKDLQLVRLDLSDLAFMDAAGLTALLEVKALLGAQGGRLSLYRPQPLILRLLDVTELTDSFDIDLDGARSNER